jgi:thiol:disulfide interchange protein DsbD
MRRIGPLVLLALLGCCFAAPRSMAATGADVDAVVNQSRASRSGDDFLPPEKAFLFSASAAGPDRVRLAWVIAPGYYLYRDRIRIISTAASSATAAGATADGSLGAAEFPPGQVKAD